MKQFKSGDKVQVHRPSFEDERRKPPSWTLEMNDINKKVGKVTRINLSLRDGTRGLEITFTDGSYWNFRTEWVTHEFHFLIERK